jgi:ubiquinone/menaquinone biosynthesis C-methylase UbiE
MATSETFETRRDSFARKVIEILNHGALNLALGLGYRLGLFEAMAGIDQPRTSEFIAKRAKLDERYVREWLGVMSSGGIVEITAETGGPSLYFLPREHAALLIRDSGSDNLGVYTQEIPLLTILALEPVVEGFKTGMGVAYNNYPTFQAFMTELSDAKHRRVLVDCFLPTVDNGALVARLNQGLRVCDLGCGQGGAVLLMAQAFPKSTFVGLDVSCEAINTASRAAQRLGLPNVDFVNMDASLLAANGALVGSFDYITAFDAIHDQTRPQEALKGVYNMLNTGGYFSMVDIAAASGHIDNRNHPMGPFLYTVSLMHCLPVGLVDSGAGLGMMWGRETAVKMLEDAGFGRVEVLEMENDPFNYHYLCQK